MLSLKLLWRNWRSGELRLLAAALLLAVAVVSAIAIFTQRLEGALIKQSNTFLGADRVVRSSRSLPVEWYDSAGEAGLKQAQTLLFNSMTFAGDAMYLASVKAVSDEYPLLGELEISDEAFNHRSTTLERIQSGPPRGEVWVDSRLLPLLDIELGEQLFVGESELLVSKVLVREPDRGDSLSLLGARLMMHIDDVPATEVIQPGSRIRHNWLLSGDEAQLSAFLETLKKEFSPHERIMDLQASQRGLSSTLDRGKQFLGLAAMIGLLLAGLAIAIAAQQFARRHTDQVALLKSLGAGANHIRSLYAKQLFILAVVASLGGLALGEVLQRAIASIVSSMYPLDLAFAGLWPYSLGLLTGLLCLLCFALPPLWQLPTVPPIRVLRRDIHVATVSGFWQAALGIAAVFILVAVYSQNLVLTAVVMLGFFALLALAAGIALLMLKLGRVWGSRSGSSWRLAWASLLRHRGQTVAQILVFATAIMLLLVIFVVRTSLIEEWRYKLPDNAPNHFLVNIAQNEVEPVRKLFTQEELDLQGLYPMVRARLTEINNSAPDESLKKQVGVLNREANLSWTPTLPEDNRLLEGKWWPEMNLDGQTHYVSVEQELAERLNLKLGDQLTFSVGGLNLSAEISSIRSLNWDSMRPNFYFLFSPGALDSYSPTYLSSVYIPAEKKPLINDLLRQSPTILVVELDLVIEQIQNLTAQVSDGVELVLILVLLAGVMVLLAAVNASMDYRLQEAGILRALGSSRQRILGSTALEFICLGALAGFLAVIGAELLLLGMQQWVLETPLQAHPLLWLAGPIIGAVIVCAMGLWASRKVVTVPPLQVLRELA
ncbi:ABC transporter permease [Pseudoteredinibacter isoporae]|uniref:ABC transporter permease n=1 Tax=Pseudoteredinibacter isoporae TaxID=570281 RepID=UPI00310B1D37